MSKTYRQFDLEERCEIAQRRKAGETIRQIAAALDRAPSSVSRELRRNDEQTQGYKPVYAGQQAKARRWRGSKLERCPSLQDQVLARLGQGWSPEEVAGRLRREQGHGVISYETIYRFIERMIARTKDYAWRLYLPRAKSQRGCRGRKGGSSVLHIAQRTSIALRPEAANDRQQPGHWEGDLLLFSRYSQAVLNLHERTSRLSVLSRQPNKAAAPVARTIQGLLAPLPPPLRQTLTFDNGTEFALHHRLRQPLGIGTFFCDPYAPWQKGGVENANGRLRRQLPRNTDLNTVSDHQLIQIARRYNHTPRKCLDYQTPAEVFSHLLHLNCESTFPPSRE